MHKISLFSGPILGLFRQIGIYVKEKHSTLHKTVSSVKVGSIAEYFTLNSTQFSRTTVDIFSCINFKLLRQIAKNILFNCATRLNFFIINNFGFKMPYFLKKRFLMFFLVSYFKQWFKNDRISYFDKVWVFIKSKIACSLNFYHGQSYRSN